MAYYFRHPGVAYRTFRGYISNRYAIEQQWKSCMDYPLNLDNPQTFNEKLQWLKLYDHNPLYTTLVDKYRVKQWVADKIGAQYVIPTLAVYGSSSEIDIEKLPNSFVLKCNHDSGSVYICKDKRCFDFKGACVRLDEALQHNYFYAGREWPYKNVKPLIFAEPYLEDEITHDLKDYKLFCFNGKMTIFKIDYDRQTNHRANYYDSLGNLLPFGEIICPPSHNRHLEIPESLSTMIALAEKISQNIPFVRVDFYDTKGSVLFGECTFFPNAGLGRFTNQDWDYKLGEYLDLPNKKYVY